MTLEQFDTAAARIRDAIAKDDTAGAYEMASRLVAALKAERKRRDQAEVNFDGVPDEALRRQVDPPFVALAQSLDVAYYEYWKRGRDYDWHGYTRQATDAENKAQFDLLTGLIWHEHAVALDDADQRAPAAQKIPAHRKVVDTESGLTKRAASEAWMQARRLRLPASARALVRGRG